MGGPRADVEDVAQEVFLVVRRKLARFDGRNLPAWLYRITAHVVANYRRKAWFRKLAPGSGSGDDAELSRATGETAPLDPSELLERREARARLDRILERMSARLRETFVLFEIDGYSGGEIAALQGIPEATVWTRLHAARKQFFALVAEMRRSET